jgi:hypothetical protein
VIVILFGATLGSDEPSIWVSLLPEAQVDGHQPSGNKD